MPVRLKAIEQSALAVASWFAKQPLVKTVLHPALPSCPGHATWKRDFTGSTGVFSIVFDDSVTVERIRQFLDRLELFKMGYSWGGVTSLVVPYFDLVRVTCASQHLVRFNIGLEATEDLISDLDRALSKL